MNLKVFYVSFINLLVALAVTPANAKTRNHLTDECYQHVSAFFENKNIKFDNFLESLNFINKELFQKG